jgi:hypothetical protein
MMLVTGVCNTILNKFQVRLGDFQDLEELHVGRNMTGSPANQVDYRTCNVSATVIPMIPSYSNSLSFRRKCS